MKKILIIISLLSLTLVGCSTVNTAERLNPESQAKMVNDKRIITDDSLNDYAYIAAINEAKVSGLLKIQVKLVNSSSAARKIRYQFTWIDENGMAFNGVTTNWEVLELEGGEATFISAVATNPRVKDFTLKLLPDER